MATEIVCPDCGIRFSEQLQGCPWCGRARPRAAATLPSAVPAAPGLQAAPRQRPTRPAPAATPPPAPRLGSTPPHTVPTGGPVPTGGLPAPAPPTAPPVNGHPAPIRTHAAPQAARTAPAARAAPAPARPVALNGASRPATPAPAATTVLVAPPPPPPVPAAPAREPFGRRVKRLLVTAVVVVALLTVGALLAEFAPLGPLAAGGGEVAAVEPAPGTAVVTAGDQVTQPPAVTAPAATAAPTTVAEPTESPGAGTLIPAFGEPLGIRELTLGVDGIGPLEIGADGNEVFGRLVASLGQPSEVIGPTESTGEFGTCPGERLRVARFGTLAAVNLVDDAGHEVFAGYEVNVGFHDGSTDPAADMRTISGLRAGDTVGDLERIYSHLDVSFHEGPDGPLFELRRPSDSALLLTGPVSATSADGIVRGIASPSACG